MAILAFDVGGSSVKYAVVKKDGTIGEKGSFKTPADLEGFYKGLQQVKEKLASEHKIRGAAFSMPGAVDDERGIIGGASAIPYIHDFTIKKALEKILELPVTMENDANCAALGEVWLGAAKDKKDVAFLVIGSGVGGALVKNGHIHHGAHLHGGEFGFMVVDEEGTILSEAASTENMVRHCEQMKGAAAGSLDGKKVFAMADDGDADAKLAIKQMIEQLARAIYNIQYSYDPECFVIGGGISAREDFVPAIDAAVNKILEKVRIARVRPDVRQAKFGNDANLLGAVYHFLQHK
ncbi:ROK family protein [Mitsuokella sp. WILCCON 0060]|uniref:ROK family protein n=1 Tax=unclassified Mitsuokella TaxID=2637239 RepID=UPI003F0C1BA7